MVHTRLLKKKHLASQKYADFLSKYYLRQGGYHNPLSGIYYELTGVHFECQSLTGFDESKSKYFLHYKLGDMNNIQPNNTKTELPYKVFYPELINQLFFTGEIRSIMSDNIFAINDILTDNGFTQGKTFSQLLESKLKNEQKPQGLQLG